MLRPSAMLFNNVLGGSKRIGASFLSLRGQTRCMSAVADFDSMAYPMPSSKPESPDFSSGPCKKRPGWSTDIYKAAATGRSHRSKIGKAKLQQAIDDTRRILGVPDDYRIGIVPASDTGAIEMAMWSMLGERPVSYCAISSKAISAAMTLLRRNSPFISLEFPWLLPSPPSSIHVNMALFCAIRWICVTGSPSEKVGLEMCSLT